MTKFERWWHDHGSGIVPERHEDQEQHARRVAERAWYVSSCEPCDGNHGAPACSDPECWQR